MHNKALFRKEVLENRKKIKSNIISLNSKKIFENLISTNLLADKKNVMLYLDFNNEVETKDIIEYLFSSNQNVLVPISIVKTKELLISQINSLDDVEIRTYGIREPKPDRVNPVDHKDIDLVIVPGVAFDENGFRLGYGGGFYDRFIKGLRPNCITIAIAFESQVFKSIPKEDHDISVDFVITEDRIIDTSL